MYKFTYEYSIDGYCVAEIDGRCEVRMQYGSPVVSNIQVVCYGAPVDYVPADNLLAGLIGEWLLTKEAEELYEFAQEQFSGQVTYAKEMAL